MKRSSSPTHPAQIRTETQQTQQLEQGWLSEAAAQASTAFACKVRVKSPPRFSSCGSSSSVLHVSAQAPIKSVAYLPRAWKPEPSARITLWVNNGITVHIGSSMLLHLCVCVRRVDAVPPWLQRSTSWQLQSSFSGRCLNSVSARGSASESKHTMTSESQQLALLTIPEHELRETVITPSMVVARSCMQW